MLFVSLLSLSLSSLSLGPFFVRYLVSRKAFLCALSVRYFVYSPIQLTARYRKVTERTVQTVYSKKEAEYKVKIL